MASALAGKVTVELKVAPSVEISNCWLAVMLMGEEMA